MGYRRIYTVRVKGSAEQSRITRIHIKRLIGNLVLRFEYNSCASDIRYVRVAVVRLANRITRYKIDFGGMGGICMCE